MTFILQSKYVCRTGSDQSPFVIWPGHQEEDNLDMTICSNTQDLPTLSSKTAEHLDMPMYSVSGKKAPSAQMKDKRLGKRKYQSAEFEDEVPFVPFSKLPHPKDLFGKRSRRNKEDYRKKEKFKANTVDSHNMQLHQKLAQQHLMKSGIVRPSVKSHEDVEIQANHTSHSQPCNTNKKGAASLPLPDETSYKGSDHDCSSRKVLSCSLYEYPSLMAPSLTASRLTEYDHRLDKTDKDSYSSFHFHRNKLFEE